MLARRELWALIKQLKTSYDHINFYLEEVEALSDRIGVMTKGRLAAVGTSAELTEQTGTASLEDAFITLSGGAL